MYILNAFVLDAFHVDSEMLLLNFVDELDNKIVLVGIGRYVYGFKDGNPPPLGRDYHGLLLEGWFNIYFIEYLVWFQV